MMNDELRIKNYELRIENYSAFILLLPPKTTVGITTDSGER